MLARAPGDVTRANAAQVKRSRPPGRSPHPAAGQCSQLRRERTHGGRTADQRTRAADSAQISQRRAAGMRCAAGQLAERRADCAADSAHIWSTRSASMVDLRPGPGRCAEPAGPRFPSVHAKTGPITGSTLCGSNRGHHRPSRSASVRPGAPQGPVCGAGDAKRDRSRGGRGRPGLVRDAPARSRGRSTTEPHDRYTAAQACGSRVPSMAARATSVRRRLWLRA